MGKGLKLVGFDLGAESGRAVLGTFDGQELSLEEVHRFANEPVHLAGALHWDVLRLFHEMKRGLALCVQRHGADLAGLAIDTWGLDYGLLDASGELLGNPYHYRDHRLDGMVEEAFKLVTREEIYAQTGIQFMQINTLYQLLATRRSGSPLLDLAEDLLLMPDLLGYFFSGEKVSEFTIATTTQMFNPRSNDWAWDLLTRMGLPRKFLKPVTRPGTVVGPLLSSVAREVGAGRVPVIATAGHDTGAAVAAVPASGPDYAYISSGTWSLIGVEVSEPSFDTATLDFNLTNEGGVCGTFRLLKNVMGLWLVQQCRRAWERSGEAVTYDQLARLAAEAKPRASFIDPDDLRFLNPDDMPVAIREFCAGSGQAVPATEGEVIRCVLESLAMKYRWVLAKLKAVTGRRVEVIHVVGGGAQNRLLCQLTADVTGLPVVAGPVEATVIGNIMVQALALGEVGSLAEIRDVVRHSQRPVTYEPADASSWDEVYGRFVALVERA